MAVATKWDNRIYTNIYNALNGKCDIVREANDDEFTKNTVLLEQIHGATAKPDLMLAQNRIRLLHVSEEDSSEMAKKSQN